jgi:hypothetical protein
MSEPHVLKYFVKKKQMYCCWKKKTNNCLVNSFCSTEKSHFYIGRRKCLFSHETTNAYVDAHPNFFSDFFFF